jgi:hypothetical protein
VEVVEVPQGVVVLAAPGMVLSSPISRVEPERPYVITKT